MVSSELLKEFGFSEEEMETAIFRKGPWQTEKTGFPKPAHRYRIILESFNQSIEETYFWILDHLRQNIGYAEIEKISDIFAASEHSSFFGAAWQRIGINQDKASQFLATIGKMVKEMFQLVREIRILDERLSYYEDSFTTSKSSESAEITLKGIWIDMVEQGAKNPASVYGMARELQFITLPDLFFSTHPKNAKDVDATVDNLEFNRKVKEVLKRKLRAFMEWKEHTFKELKVRRKFTLKYLRQHYDIIHMYMMWVKPYIKNVQRLALADKSGTPDLIRAFEGSIIEIELLAKKLPMTLKAHEWPEKNKHINSVILVHFYYRTRPSMGYNQEGGQRGPLHVGRIEMTLRAYTWTDKEVEQYLRMKEKEDFELLTTVDTSVKAAVEALGDELEGYLKEAGETFRGKYDSDEEKTSAKTPSVADPFVSVLKGFGEMVTSFGPHPVGKAQHKEKINKHEMEIERKHAGESVAKNIYYLYNDYKKAHGLMVWTS